MNLSPLKVIRPEQSDARAILADGAIGLSERVLVGLQEGTGGFDVRYIELKPGGVSTDHKHPWEQANYVLEGMCNVELDGAVHSLTKGHFLYIPPNTQHCFRNTGGADLVLLAVRGAQSR